MAEQTVTTPEDEETFARQTEVMKGVANELHRQLEKWGTQNHPDVGFYLILLEEVGEAAQAVRDAAPFLSGEVRYVLNEAIKTGILAKHLIENGDATRVNPGKRHDINHELIQVAAVAVAFVENRVRKDALDNAVQDD